MILRLAWQQLWRSRNSAELRILSVAFALAIFSVTLLTCLTQGLGDLFIKDASTQLGADLIIESPHPLPDTLLQSVKDKGISFSRSIEFFSMLSTKYKVQLASVNSVSDPFPLRGELSILTSAKVTKMINHVPPRGEIWVEESLMEKLAIHLNESLQIGNSTLKMTGVIQKRPLALSSTNMLAPICYVNNDDLSKLAVLQPGSRATYRLLLKLEPQQSKAIQASLSSLMPKEANWVTPQSGRRGLSQTIVTIQQYLSVILLIQVLLAGIAIAICAHEFSAGKKKTVALMRCLGAKSHTIFLVHFFELFFMAGILLSLSIGFGYGAASVILEYSKSFGLHSVALDSQGGLLGMLTGLLLLFGFALPPIYELRKVAPSQIFQNAFATSMGIHLISYVTASVSLLLLFFAFVNEPNIAIQLCIRIFIFGAVIYAIAYGLWLVLTPLKQYGSLVWRFGIAYLIRHRTQTISQWLVFTLVIMLLLVVQIMKQDFVQQWRTQLSPNTPNYFLINVQDDQIGPLKTWFSRQGISDVTFYPMVRGRMTLINGNEVGAHRGLSRPINLTWMTQLPKDNLVISGESWDKGLHGQAVISIEKGFAERQGLHLNDTVSFQIDNEVVTANIIQIRTVEWTSFKPNFFVIFPENVLNDFPHSYMTSIHLEADQKGIMYALAKEYVEISVIDIDDILQSVRAMVDKLAIALNSLLVIVFVLGILIMYASLLSSLKERMQESAMLQILGAKKAFIGKLLIIEFSLVALFSGMLGSGMAMLLAKELAERYFTVEFNINMKWMVLGTLLSTLVITLFGLAGARRVFKVSPLWLLRQNS